VRTARNVAIVALLAVPVAFVPGGGNAVEAILTVLLLAFLAGIAFAVYTLHRQNQLTLSTLPDSRRAVFYGAAGGLALLIAGQDELTATSGGVLIWIGLIVACGFAIFAVWREANTL
jgi:hypothetical protein